MDISSQEQPKTVSEQFQKITGKKVGRVRLTENSVLVRIHLGHVGRSKTIRQQDVAIDSEGNVLKVHKELLRSKEIKAINKLDIGIRKYVYARALKPGTFGAGIYFLGIGMADSFEKQMREFAAERRRLVADLCNRYDPIIASDKEVLSRIMVGGTERNLFDSKDYLSVEAMRKKFEMTWQYLSLIPPKSLEAVSEDLYLQAEAQMKKEIADATDVVRYALRKEMQEFVTWAASRLSPNQPGEKKVITSKMTGKINEFLELIQARNITGDVELSELVSKARLIMMGVNAEAIRGSEDLRTTLAAGFNDIKSTIDTWAIEEPSRDIDLDF